MTNHTYLCTEEALLVTSQQRPLHAHRELQWPLPERFRTRPHSQK